MIELYCERGFSPSESSNVFITYQAYEQGKKFTLFLGFLIFVFLEIFDGQRGQVSTAGDQQNGHYAVDYQSLQQ